MILVRLLVGGYLRHREFLYLPQACEGVVAGVLEWQFYAGSLDLPVLVPLLVYAQVSIILGVCQKQDVMCAYLVLVV